MYRPHRWARVWVMGVLIVIIVLGCSWILGVKIPPYIHRRAYLGEAVIAGSVAGSAGLFAWRLARMRIILSVGAVRFARVFGRDTVLTGVDVSTVVHTRYEYETRPEVHKAPELTLHAPDGRVVFTLQPEWWPAEMPDRLAAAFGIELDREVKPIGRLADDEGRASASPHSWRSAVGKPNVLTAMAVVLGSVTLAVVVAAHHSHAPPDIAVAGHIEVIFPTQDNSGDVMVDGLRCEGRGGALANYSTTSFVTVTDTTGRPLSSLLLPPGRFVSPNICDFGFSMRASERKDGYLLQVGTPPTFVLRFDDSSASHLHARIEPNGH